MSTSSPPETQHRTPALAMHLRAATADDSARTVEATIATEGRVVIFDSRRGELIEEILLVDGASFKTSVPLLQDHRREVPAIVGSVRNFRREAGRIAATLHFGADEQSVRAWGLVRDGHVTDTSVSYSVVEFTDIEPGRTARVHGQTYVAGDRFPLRVSTRWEIREVSLVPIGADPGATIRSLSPNREDSSMSFANETRPSRPALTAAMMARFGLHYPNANAVREGRRFEQNNLERFAEICCDIDGIEKIVGSTDTSPLFRAIAVPDSTFGDVLFSSIEALLLDSYDAERDSTLTWTRESRAKNFQIEERVRPDTAGDLDQMPRGAKATETTAGVTVEGVQVVRFAKMLVVDEQTLLDDRIGLIASLVESVGRAARRLRPTLVYTTLMCNPTLAADDKPIFHEDHGNLGVTALDATSLGAAIAAMRCQNRADENGNIAPFGIEPIALIVPPSLETSARALLRTLELRNTQNVTLIVEPLLQTGATNPVTGEHVEGSETRWFLTGRPADIDVAFLAGKNKPSVWRTKLERGRYGVGYVVQHNIGVAAVGFRSLYMSTGEGGGE